MPRWSDGEEAAASGRIEADVETIAATLVGADPVADATPAPATPSGPQSSASYAPNECPWCATPAAEGATRCTTCGAALAQRESIGDLVIPGLTAVDPALKDLDGRPIHLRGPSPSQGAASGIIVAAAAGGPIGLAILGGVGAIAATEFLGAGGEKGKGHEHLGETSEAVIQAVERLDRGESLPTATDPTPRPSVDPWPGEPAPATEEAIDGRS
jgi:hypothetical protein